MSTNVTNMTALRSTSTLPPGAARATPSVSAGRRVAAIAHRSRTDGHAAPGTDGASDSDGIPGAEGGPTGVALRPESGPATAAPVVGRRSSVRPLVAPRVRVRSGLPRSPVVDDPGPLPAPAGAGHDPLRTTTAPTGTVAGGL